MIHQEVELIRKTYIAINDNRSTVQYIANWKISQLYGYYVTIRPKNIIFINYEHWVVFNIFPTSSLKHNPIFVEQKLNLGCEVALVSASATIASVCM